jgi:hypothetical protein
VSTGEFWMKDADERLLGQWHMRAGHTTTGVVLTACDRSFSTDDLLEHRALDEIPESERCAVCQGVHAATAERA